MIVEVVYTANKTSTFYLAGGQYNRIEVDGIKIRNKEDNSPDQIAVKKKVGSVSQVKRLSIYRIN